MRAFIVVGATGTGKTTYTKGLVRSILPNGGRPIVYDVNREWGATFLPKIGDFLDFVARVEGRVIVFEDATIFFSNRGRSERMVEMLIGKRHHRNTIILLFHALVDVPLYIWRQCNWLVLFKTGDTPSSAMLRIGGRKVLEDAASSVLSDPNPYARRIVRLV